MTTLPQTSPMRLPRPHPSQLAIPSANGHGTPALAHAPQSAQTNLSGADTWRVIRANLWLIIGLFVASGVAGYFLNWWLATHYARYTSNALIRIQVPSELPQIDDSRMLIGDPSPQGIEVEQQTQAATIMNPYFLSTLIEDPQSPIRQTSWFQQYGTRIDQAKDDLMKKLDVAPRQNTRLISISMSCASPKDAVVIVREVAQRHINDRRQRIQNLQIQKSSDLQNLIEKYRQEQNNYREKLGNLSQDLAKNLFNPDGVGGLDTEFSALFAQASRAEEQYSEARMHLLLFQQLAKEGLPSSLLLQFGPDKTGSLQSLLEELEVDLDVAKSNGGSESRQVKSMQTRVDAIRERIDQLQGANRDQMVASIQKELQFKVALAENGLKVANQRMQDIRKSRIDLSAKQLEYLQAKEQEHTASDLLHRAENERDKLELFIQQNNWSTAEWAMQPDLPETPSFPKLWITMALSLTAGLALALGIAFLREVMDTTVRSPRDIAKVGQLNLLGLIPHQADDPESQSARLPLAIYEAPQSMVAEQFRHVRTRLQHSASLDTVRSLLVTGTSPGDGKTTVACNLAAGLALNGRRILLVDANFRRPQLHAVFNLSNDSGFGDVLNSLDLFDDAVRESEVPNLSVLTCGAKSSNPTELLESQLLIDFVERALEEYDHVIFDTGPLLLVSETCALAPRVDGVVTVVRARGNSRGLLQRLRDQLRQLKAEHLGVILNAVRSQSGGYYAPMIKSYYAYQNS